VAYLLKALNQQEDVATQRPVNMLLNKQPLLGYGTVNVIKSLNK
jgi:hypothetical protein